MSRPEFEAAMICYFIRTNSPRATVTK